MTRIHSLTLAALIVSTTSLAAERISGTFKFEERKPFVALVYIVNDHSSQRDICGSLDQKNKAFSIPIVVGQKGCEISFSNSDQIDHNIFANDIRNGVSFDVGLIPPGGSANTQIDWEHGKIIRIGCKIHPKMRSYIANLDTSYYAIVDFDAESDYEFSIEDVPSEANQLVIWFPKMDGIQIELNDGDEVSLPVTRREKQYGSLSVVRKEKE
ncbi:MAG: hypothetical protein AAGB06_03230 [Verrucomicrobiota bacterium]